MELSSAESQTTPALFDDSLFLALPAWSQTLGVFDLETTGIDVQTDRVVTAHVGTIDAAGNVVHHRSWLADPGVPIPTAAQQVHGVSTERAQAEGRPAAEVIGEIVAELRQLFSANIPVVAYNASFDFTLLWHEATRHGLEPIADPTPVLDPLVVDKTFDRYRPGRRTLEATATHYGVPLESAHEAAADAIAAGRIAQALARRFADRLPASGAELHTKQVSWARAQAASLTDYFIQIGRLEPTEELDGAWPIRAGATSSRSS